MLFLLLVFLAPLSKTDWTMLDHDSTRNQLNSAMKSSDSEWSVSIPNHVFNSDRSGGSLALDRGFLLAALTNVTTNNWFADSLQIDVETGSPHLYPLISTFSGIAQGGLFLSNDWFYLFRPQGCGFHLLRRNETGPGAILSDWRVDLPCAEGSFFEAAALDSRHKNAIIGQYDGSQLIVRSYPIIDGPAPKPNWETEPIRCADNDLCPITVHSDYAYVLEGTDGYPDPPPQLKKISLATGNITTVKTPLYTQQSGHDMITIARDGTGPQLYYFIDSEKVFAFDKLTDKLYWTSPFWRQTCQDATKPVLSEDGKTIYVVCPSYQYLNTQLLLIDAYGGSIRQDRFFEKTICSDPIILSNGKIVIPCRPWDDTTTTMKRKRVENNNSNGCENVYFKVISPDGSVEKIENEKEGVCWVWDQYAFPPRAVADGSNNLYFCTNWAFVGKDVNDAVCYKKNLNS